MDKSSIVSHAPWIALLLLILHTASAISAETLLSDGNTSRVRVGLALSGGGARGAAHLGVIRVLEEHRVPIDYIAGTSMGAIIGGLYSSGLNTDEIESALVEMDWNTVFDDRSIRNERSFRRKRDDDLYLIKYKPGFVKGKLKLSRGFVQGQKIELELSRQLLPVATVDDFDQLTIPFRAVAADITTGEAIILNNGNLAQAIRASMSIPTLIAPAFIDERYLVDGGVANNLPVDVVKEMGADVVIAIDIGTPLSSQEEIDSALAITEQLTGFLTQRGSQQQIDLLTENDLLITPELGNVATADFNKFPLAIEAGIKAANAYSDAFTAVALSPTDYADYREALQQPDRTRPVISHIKISNNSALSDDVIRSRLIETNVNQPLDEKALERDIARLYGLGLFENIYYELDNQNTESVLNLIVRERSWGPSYMQFGIEYNSNGGGENIFNIGASYLSTALNSRAGEWRTGIQLGSEPAVFSEIHQPFGSMGHYFVNPLVGYRERIFSVAQESSSIASLNLNETFAQIGLGRELGTWGEFRGGLRFSRVNVENRIGELPMPIKSLDGGEGFLRFSVDEFDSIHFPKNGSQLTFEWLGSRKSLGAEATFDQVKLSAAFAKTRNRNTFLASGTYETTTKGAASLQNNFALGGFGQLSGFLANEFSGQHRALANLVFYRQVVQNSFAPLYAGMTIEHGNVANTRGELSLNQGTSAGSLWLGADTIVGPIYIAYGRGEEGASTWYLFIGSPF